MVITDVPAGSFSYTLVLNWLLLNWGLTSLMSSTVISTFGKAQLTDVRLGKAGQPLGPYSCCDLQLCCCREVPFLLFV